MFTDFYALLEIPFTATQEEIKDAFRKQALKWHPDKNPGVDTTERMRLIIEAHLILKDLEARQKYDYQYQLFKNYEEEKEKYQSVNQDPRNDFNIDDDVLKRWMANAREQAVELAKQALDDLIGMSKVGAKEGGKAMGTAFMTQLVLGFIVLLVFGLSKACSH